VGLIAALGLAATEAVAKKKGKKKKKKKKQQQAMIETCRSELLASICRYGDCVPYVPGQDAYCDICVPDTVSQYLPCCDAFAASGGPPAVNVCVCDRCNCCDATITGGAGGHAIDVARAVADTYPI
jgi:hypothetical protein